MICIGADPGLSGAIAVASSRSGLLAVEKLPIREDRTGRNRATVRRAVDARGLDALVREWSGRFDFAGEDVIAVVERMQPFDRAGPTTMLSLGHSAGVIEGVLGRYARETLQPLPQQWKKTWRLTRDKAQSVQVARELAPESARLIRSHDRAEAVLLAYWGLGEINGVMRGAIV